MSLNSGSGSGRLDIGPYHVEGNTAWTFYAISRWDDGTHIIYQGRSDGTLNWISTTFDSFVLKTSSPFCIGQAGNGTYSSKFVGGVDDVAIWTRALRHEDIRLIYESGLSGLAIGDLFAPATAVWTGAGSDPSDPADPDNWSCADEDSNPLPGTLPGRTTDVTISGAMAFDIVSEDLLCKSVLFDNVTLSSDRDWSGLDISKIANGSSIDLRGHRLTLKGVNGANVAANVCTITDTTTDTANPGVLEINTPSGVTFENKAIALTGNLHLEKIGTGTFIANRTNQSYTGGTLVKAGSAKFGDAASTHPFGATGTSIEAEAGADIDAYSRNVQNYTIVLSGGKYLNTYNGVSGDMRQLVGNIVLRADSEIVFDSQTSKDHDKILVDNAVWDLGGYTLTIRFNGKDPDFYFASHGNSNPTTGRLYLKNGTVKTVAKSDGSGWWHDTRTDGTEGGSYDIGTRIRHFGESTVSNLTFRMADNYAGGTGVYKVYGTFKPISAYGHNVQMLDGSTIDLSMKTGAWSTNYSTTDFVVTFATGATVTVNLEGRVDLETIANSASPYVMTWETQPTATFVPDVQTAEHYKLVPDASGLRIKRKPGLIISFH